MGSVEPQYHKILIRLADANVEFIVVGMAAAVVQGVPLTTWDLDIVHRRTPENVDRLLKVLQDLNAVARGDPRRLKPNETHLIGPGHIWLETRFGDFDCLGAIDGGRSYEDLLRAASPIAIAEDHPAFGKEGRMAEHQNLYVALHS